MTFSHYAFLLVLSTVSSSCSKELTTEELESYLADSGNGLTQQQKINDLTIRVAYRPTSLLTTEGLNEAKDSPVQYYLLSISRSDKEVLDPSRGFSTYSALLQTLAFHPQQYIKLTSARGDTLLPSNAILERTYGMGASTRMLLAFPEKASAQDVVLHVGEFGLHTGNLLFAFRQAAIAAVPPLKSPTQNDLNP